MSPAELSVVVTLALGLVTASVTVWRDRKRGPTAKSLEAQAFDLLLTQLQNRVVALEAREERQALHILNLEKRIDVLEKENFEYYKKHGPL